MCAGSHTTHHTQRPSSPTSSSQRARSWLSLIHTASPVPGVPMVHFPTPKGSHLFLPPVGQAFGGTINSLASRQYLYVCLEVPSAASQTWEQAMQRGTSQPGLTIPPSPHLQPTQERTFLCPSSPCTPSSYSAFQLCCPHSCAIQRLGCLLSCCLPSKGAAHHTLAHPAVPCSLALGTRACRGAMGGPQGDEEAPRAKQELQQQVKRPC